MQISVLCVDRLSNYHKRPELDLWTAERDAYNYAGSNPVIVHPPCQQWSRLKAFAKVNQREKDLAFFCLERVQLNGGIFEHPSGSSFFKAAGITPTISIDQSWFGFPARKRTYLYFHGYKPQAFPLSFDAPLTTVDQMNSGFRSRMTLQFIDWLVSCIDGNALSGTKSINQKSI